MHFFLRQWFSSRLPGLQRATWRALCSQKTSKQEETTFHRLIEQPCKALGISEEVFWEAHPLCFSIDQPTIIQSSLLIFDQQLKFLGLPVPVWPSPFLLCDVAFRITQSQQEAQPQPNTDPALLPWGLVRQGTVNTWVDKFARQGHITFDLEIPLQLHSGATQELLQRVGGMENLLEGAKQAYRFLALHFADPRWPGSEDVLCPKLHRMLANVADAYEMSEVRAKVDVEECELEAELVGIWTESGEGESANAITLPKDVSQLIRLISAGYHPDPTVAEGRRVVAAIKFKSLERLQLVIPPHFRSNVWLNTIGQSSMRPQTHYWVFESWLKDEAADNLEWRVRCINMAIVPSEGLKVLDLQSNDSLPMR